MIALEHRSALHKQLVALHIEWFNHWINVADFAQHYGLPRAEMDRILCLSAPLYERDEGLESLRGQYVKEKPEPHESGKSELHAQLTRMYLEWVNDWVTVPNFAAWHGIPETAAQALIDIGRVLHETNVEEWQLNAGMKFRDP